MKRIIHTVFFIFLSGIFTGCDSQINTSPRATSTPMGKAVGGGCDGCEIMYRGMPANIRSVDTSVAWTEKGQKLLITGIVYKPGGRIPAPGVIVYYYHSDNTGRYTKKNDKAESQTVHGHIRGWVKTGANGHYEVYTTRPAPYPGNEIPAHIHLVIKEPALNEYYIDDLVFDDDPLLTEKKRKQSEGRGGNGILGTIISGDLQIAQHNIILGLNVPNYPADKKLTIYLRTKQNLRVEK